jgi:hypothetical protein
LICRGRAKTRDFEKVQENHISGPNFSPLLRTAVLTAAFAFTAFAFATFAFTAGAFFITFTLATLAFATLAFATLAFATLAFATLAFTAFAFTAFAFTAFAFTSVRTCNLHITPIELCSSKRISISHRHRRHGNASAECSSYRYRKCFSGCFKFHSIFLEFLDNFLPYPALILPS